MVLCICPNPSIDCYADLNNFQFGSVNRITSLKEFPGGKGTHVALALAEMDVDVTLFGFWAGANGDWISKECKAKDITIDGIDVEGSNRKCYTFRSENTDLNATEILEPGPNISNANWNFFLRRLEVIIQNFDIVSLSGSWPDGAPKNAAYQVAGICNEYGKKLFLDSSGDQLKNALKSKIYGLHVNEHEAKEVFGTDNVEYVLNQLDGTLDLLALTQGKKGLNLASKCGSVHALKKLEEVISPVGSGDCLTAGIIYALLNNENIEEMARHGAAFGAANCVNEDLGMLQKKNVEEFLPQTILKRIA